MNEPKRIALPYKLNNDTTGIVVMGFMFVLTSAVVISGIIQFARQTPVFLIYVVLPLFFLFMCLSLMGSTTFFDDRLVCQGLLKSQEQTVLYRDIGKIEIATRLTRRSTKDVIIFSSKNDGKSLLEINLVAVNDSSPMGQDNTARAATFLNIITRCAPGIALNARATEVLQKNHLQISPSST